MPARAHAFTPRIGSNWTDTTGAYQTFLGEISDMDQEWSATISNDERSQQK